MKKHFQIAGRGSWLSLAQVEVFREIVQRRFPGTEIHFSAKETWGDKDQSTPLHMINGKDFFTKEVQGALDSGEADFAVHSMKDVSSIDFFEHHHFAVIDREDLHDVVIFNPDVIEKIKHGKEIVIGTSSPRRAATATGFLKQALPRYEAKDPAINAVPVRGNVDIRLRKLDEGLYDGIILAVAGLNRLLRYAPASADVRRLLQDKKLMVLPLFECPPAAGQGAIVVEANPANRDAVAVLDAVRDVTLTTAILKERHYAEKYGYGDSREFGVFHIDTPHLSFTYASGKDLHDRPFAEWDFERPPYQPGELFSAATHMKSFFSYRYYDTLPDGGKDSFFVSSHKAIHNDATVGFLQQKRVWAAGTKTWLSLAEKGIWVEGCADGLGLETLAPLLESPLIGLEPERIQIITNEASKNRWIAAGWSAVATYLVIPERNSEIQEQIKNAGTLFWTSYQQYNMYRDDVRPDARHCCLAGKTASLFRDEGIVPHLFPDVKSFKQWEKKQLTSITGGV